SKTHSRERLFASIISLEMQANSTNVPQKKGLYRRQAKDNFSTGVYLAVFVLLLVELLAMFCLDIF
ncbi:MAG: hypothetical protein K6B46_06860, partial [Opitutales bacterium]|nr:hypothetical protein [Opitutales bacterium]